MELIINKENFEKEVLNAEKPVLLDFWATWCGPCRMLSPVISEIAEKHDEIIVGKVNVDDEPELANDFHIDSIPRLILIKNGDYVKSLLGYHTIEQIEDFLK